MNTSNVSSSRTTSKLIGLFAFALLVASSAFVGCGEDEGCEVDGQSYSSGETFECDDGCNTCRCEADGTISSTLRACFAGGAPGN